MVIEKKKIKSISRKRRKNLKQKRKISLKGGRRRNSKRRNSKRRVSKGGKRRNSKGGSKRKKSKFKKAVNFVNVFSVNKEQSKFARATLSNVLTQKQLNFIAETVLSFEEEFKFKYEDFYEYLDLFVIFYFRGLSKVHGNGKERGSLSKGIRMLKGFAKANSAGFNARTINETQEFSDKKNAVFNAWNKKYPDQKVDIPEGKFDFPWHSSAVKGIKKGDTGLSDKFNKITKKDRLDDLPSFEE